MSKSRLPILLVALLAVFAAATPALGQTASFVLSYALADGNAHPLANGAAITFPPVDVNGTTTATFSITNQGTATGTVNSIASSGSAFLLVNPTLLPAQVLAGQTLRFGVVFAPTQAGTATGTFDISVTGLTVSGTMSGSTPPPNFALRYVDPTTGNTLPLANAATLQFPNTVVGATSTITLLIPNTGTGTGSVNTIALDSGTVFQLVGLPPLPLSVGPAQQASFGVRFSPQQQQAATDVLRVNLNGQVTVVNLQAQGTQAIYSYQWTTSTGTTTVSSGGTGVIPNTVVGQTTSVAVTVTNTGLAAGQVAGIGITGQGLSLSNLPAVPFTLQPNATQQFTMTFAPTQPGAVTGRLTFGTDSITISTTGIGPQLIYSYTSGSSAVTVAANGAVVFPPLAVGSTASLTFSVQNTGTSAATIPSISLSAAGTVFSLSQLPPLPATLNAGATSSFVIGFAPNNTGTLTATLLFNTTSFTLTGNGNPPPSLPAYSFQGASGNQQPAQQPGIGLTLASAYPQALQGKLTLTFNSNVFTDDSAIQFANGGRTVNFTIPANTTQALFSGNATTVPLQTGTTAGNIVITPSFAMTSGFDLTPGSPTALTLSIPASAPQLVSGAVSGETTTGFALTLSGFTTSRVLTRFDIQITPKAGQNFSPSHLTVDVSSASAAWFRGTASSGFGGSFLVAIPFVLSNGSTTTDLVHLLQSLSITATNDVGTSAAITVAIP